MRKIFTCHRPGNLSLFLKSTAALLLLCCTIGAGAQTTLSTTAALTNDDTAAVVTFNFQNTNSYPVTITQVAGILNAFGNNTVELWYKTSAISGAPGNIAAGNGWTQSLTATVMGLANATNTSTQTLLNNVNLSIPANTTYGIAIAGYSGSTGTLRIDGASGTTTISGGGCTISVASGVGFAGNGIPPAAPTEAAQGWIGKLTFVPGNNCTGTPAVPVVSGPATICATALFTLTATGYSVGAGITHQWQYFNTTSSTWENIAGATSPSSYTATSGITAATQYRLRSGCSFSTLQSNSATITVNIGTGLPGGIYTVNNNAPSTSTNFVSLSAAAAAMACGISGPVTLNVDPASGPYEEQVTFGKIPGTSAVNTIRLNGNGAVVRHLTSITAPSILMFKGTKYMTVDSLNIRSFNTDDYCVGVGFADTVRYDSLTRCFIDLSSIQSPSTFFSAGVSMGNYNFTAADSGSMTFCYIGHNRILGTTGPGGPEAGVIIGDNFSGWGEGIDSNNVIAYNQIENMYGEGIYAYGTRNLKMLYNDIHRKYKTGNGAFFGILCWDGWDNVIDNQTKMDIIGNRIHDVVEINTSSALFYGIYAASWNNFVNDQGSRFTIANNAIYNINAINGSTEGIFIVSDNGFTTTDDDTFLVYHNTISLNANNNAGTIVGIRYTDNFGSGTGDNPVVIKNNLITITGPTSTATKFGVMYDNNSGTLDINAQRNNIYLNTLPLANQFYAKRVLVNYATHAAYQAAYPTQELGSLTVNPQYTSEITGDLTPTNLALMGNGVNLQSIVPTDINGRLRSTAPVPGAFELSADAGVTTLISPIGTYCSSVKDVTIAVKNHGILTIDSLKVGWSLNGVLQTPVNYIGTVLPNNSITLTLGTGLFLPNTPVTVKAWTYAPNGHPDMTNTNDTLTAITQSSSSIPVNLGPDDTVCTGNTRLLDAGYPGWYYTWDNLSTNQTRTVSAAGDYYVRVMALDGCLGFDTFHLYLRPLPVVDLGPDREICLGETTTFDAGHPGSTYLWDDGTTTQTRIVDTAGWYEAQVTDVYGCMGFDNVMVSMKDIPGVDGINATHADSGRYTFYPINPRYAITYRWNFGDGSPEKEGYFVQHAYTALGIYTVTLYLVGECTGLVIDHSRTVDVFSVPGDGGTGIGHTVAEGDLLLYPNPSKEKVTVQNKSNEAMKHITVYNVLGQTIIDQAADSKTTHELQVSDMASGMYTVKIETDKGYVIRKFEVQH